jgi:predicted nucleic acid-binding Zn ribbon protein
MGKGFQDIQKVLNKVLKNYNLEKDVKKEQIFENWEIIVGKNLSEKCTPIKQEENVLFLKAKNSVWSNELKLRQKDLLSLIHEKTGNKIIKKLRFL